MPQPGLPGSQFPSEDSLIRRIKDLERAVQQLAAANPLATAGISTVANGIVVNGSETVNGPLTINGPATITGTLDLPAGIIGNDALTSPTKPAVASGAATGFAVTLASQTLAVATYTVPAGFTQAAVTVNCTVGAINPNTLDDFLYSSAIINGVMSNEVFGYVAPNNGSVAVSTSKSSILTGLTGGSTFTVAVALNASRTWAANGANRAFVESSATFYR
jgi:hypothetical protein